MDLMTFNWLFWLGGFFLAYELAAVVFHWRTLSGQVWNWFSLGQFKCHWQVRRSVFLGFWVLLGMHFYFQAPVLWTVILPAIPVGAVIVCSTFVWKDAATKEKRMESVKLLNYDWRITFWKGLRPALIAGGAAAAAALVQSVDSQWLIALGVPAFLATFIIEAARNYFKQHRV